MSGTKRLYNLDEKNYFKFFGVEEKQGTSIRSLSTHYKKILNILKDDNSFIGRDHKEFAHRAFNTLVDPILRARYILETRCACRGRSSGRLSAAPRFRGK
jgi:hypothetical protein